MAARPRARARPGRPKQSSLRSRLSLPRSPLLRPEVIGVAIAAAAVASLPWLVDVRALTADVRDWVLETFGLGLFVVVALVAGAGLAIARRSYENAPLRFIRHGAGYIALGLFVWSALGLNEADWTAGSVEFRDATLGGAIGRALVGTPIGGIIVFGWLALALALLAPRVSRTLLSAARDGGAYAWEHRWPQRTVRGFGRFIRFAFRRPSFGRARDEIVIGGRTPAPGTYVGTAYEEAPVVFRPSIDPASPASPLGAGAAAQFASPATATLPPPPPPVAEAPEPPSADTADEPDDDELEADEPRQLSLDERTRWQLPPIELLQEPQPSANRKHDNAARAQLIVDTLASFGVDATVVEINEGPTVTQFGVEPGWEVRSKEVALKDADGKPLISADGRPMTERVETSRTRVRVNRITALQSDLALALAAPSLRIEAPVPGRAIVGIEVPNETATVVTLRNVMEDKEYRDRVKRSKLTIALGKGVSGAPVIADLAKMPHLLIAGATGSGKSVCLNAIVTSIITHASPDEVRFIMVDPKRVELTTYSRLPHLAFSEVIVDLDKVVGTLQAVVAEMESRYKKFAEVGVRNIEAYNRHPRVLKKLPYWVLIIDELADLMMVAPFEVEKLLCRLAQLARATGIHLIVATQRPSVDVVTGLIKANFPTRIAFAVTSVTDSRTILDMGGAEKLLGQGDMLYLPTDAGKPRRIQGVYVSDAEVERLVEFWADERFDELRPETADDLLEQALIERNGDDEDLEVDDADPLLDDARDLARRHSRISPSLLQRRLNVGYVKAQRLITVLESEGIVGSALEGESREVLAGPVGEGS